MPRGYAPTLTQQIMLSVKFGSRREMMKEIIEANTDPMKEVLHSGATFAPTPTQQIMLSNLGQGWRP